MKNPYRVSSAMAGWLVLVLSSYCLGYVIATDWAATVTTDNGILFFDSNWRKISSAAHQYSRISAFAYDEVLGKLYFSDLDHLEYRLFALDYDDTDELHKITKLVLKSPQTAYISGMAFDHLDRRLYWTEKRTRSIYYVEIDALLNSSRSGRSVTNETGTTTTPPNGAGNTSGGSSSLIHLVTTVEPDHELAGLAIDECRRHLYWTNCYLKTSNIVRASMNGTVLNMHEDQVYLPKGITVDHYRNRLYWVEKKFGRRYTIESANLEVNDQHTLHTGLDRSPADIAVKNDFIYFTDQENNEIYEMSKEPNAQSRTVYSGEHPSALILRANLLLNQQRNNPDCQTVVTRILENMQNSKPATVLLQESQQGQLTVCLNNGTVNHHTNTCLCPTAFGGKLCEIDLCNNFCAQGSCRIGRDNRPQCDCDRRYEGERCDRNRCDGFCLNGGRCQFGNATADANDRSCLCDRTGYSGTRCENPICGTDYCYNGECYVEDGKHPKCRCKAGYRGERCEEYSCNNYCLNGGQCTLDNETTVPECQCGEEFAGKRCEIAARLCSTYNEDPQWQQYCLGISKTLPLMEPKVTYCKESFNRTVVYTSLCFTMSFALLLAIVIIVHRMMKPPRPRITKKMVVTPMTSRPPTTQCEITIENCCNMNVCETPCFDTKLLTKSQKEDKQFLLEDIEDVGGSYRKLPNCGEGTLHERK
ncbi:protein cueball [Anopheles marshallii]|uniref:protein cueball n=1 Tax=Anopheles marshallii TaxID=1521116 RepID=UPI00237A4D03|nr:protein cueball [Anopheles marshallii]